MSVTTLENREEDRKGVELVVVDLHPVTLYVLAAGVRLVDCPAGLLSLEPERRRGAGEAPDYEEEDGERDGRDEDQC